MFTVRVYNAINKYGDRYKLCNIGIESKNYFELKKKKVIILC